MQLHLLLHSAVFTMELHRGGVAAKTVLLTEFNIHLAPYRKAFVDLYRVPVTDDSTRNPARSRRPKTLS